MRFWSIWLFAPKSLLSCIFAATRQLIFLAFWPNRSVDTVCSTWCIEGVMHRIMAVRELPPRLVLRIFVSGEFRKGM